MLAQQRYNAIMGEIYSKGTVQVQDLAELLNVSAMTIRRDLAELDDQGQLTRVHGGATLSTSSHEPEFAEKMAINADAKSSITQAAMPMVHSSQTIGIAGGSTCTRIAQELAANTDFSEMTVVTNSLPVLNSFSAHSSSNAKVLLTGGERTPSDAFVGPLADRSLSVLSTDILFIGAHAVDRNGLSTPNMSEARTNRAFIESAREVIAVFDATKWNVTGLMRFAGWNDINTVITNNSISHEQHSILSENIEKVVIA